MFSNLRELITSMPDENTCKAYLAKQRWNGNTVCPYCGHLKCYTIEGGKRYKCADKNCFKRFTVTVGTIFEASNIPLTKWFTAMYLAISHKKGISSYQLSRDIGVTQKTGWFMLHRIREVTRVKTPVTIGLNNPVELDETFIGGSIENKHEQVRIDFLNNPEKYQKTMVLGMVEREGKLVAKVIVTNEAQEINSNVTDNVNKGADLMTDTSSLYGNLENEYNRQAVNHTKQEFVRGNVHTNTIEGAFSLFKRSIYGIYHHITPKHTQRYLDEFTYRYNSRKVKDAVRFENTFDFINCRLRYTTLVFVADNSTNKRLNVSKKIVQMQDGVIIAEYATINKAAKATGLNNGNISQVCKGKRKTTGGFQWAFA